MGDEEASLWASKSSEPNPKKGLRASEQLSHVAWARDEESKAVKMGRKGAVWEERALPLELPWICHSFLLQVGVTAPLLVKLKERPSLRYCPATCFILGVKIKYKCCCQQSDLLTYTAMGIIYSWVKHLSVVASKIPCFQEPFYV